MPSRPHARWSVKWKGSIVGYVTEIEDESTILPSGLDFVEVDSDSGVRYMSVRNRIRERIFGNWSAADEGLAQALIGEIHFRGEVVVDVDGTQYWVFKEPSECIELQAYRTDTMRIDLEARGRPPKDAV